MSTETPLQHRPIAIAPAANGRPTPQSETESTMPFTCVMCARRKVKCDKAGPPCTTCRKTKAECTYQSPAPRKRKRKPLDDVQERLERYERLLKEHKIFGESDDADQTPTNNFAIESAINGKMSPEEVSAPPTGQLLAVEGKTRYVDSTLWKTIGVEELHPTSEDEDDEDAGDYNGSTVPSLDPVSASFLGRTSSRQSLVVLHPTYEAAMRMWKVFVASVDLIIKVLHKPTALAMLQRAAANPSSASKPAECLLFAIYHFAVTAMSELECVEMLSQPRAALQTRYHDALRQALVNANFLRSTDVAVLQAYVMLLLANRGRYDPQTLWMLTGIAVRMAQRMGLHRDGEELGLSPFDVQIRSRLFWQLLMLDGFASQLCGTGIYLSPSAYSTKTPLNINDEDIFPNMQETPKAQTSATDMMFVLVRMEIGKFHQKTKPTLGFWGQLFDMKDIDQIQEIESHIDEVENEVETKFLRYCDLFDPVHIMAMGMARAGLSMARMRLRLPRAKASKISDEQRKDLFNLTLKLLGYDIAIHTSPALDKFRWHFSALLIWDALIWVLTELQQGSPTGGDQSAWSTLDQLYACHPELLTPRRALPMAVAKLSLKAWDAHPATEKADIPEPSFLSPLRAAVEQRTASRQQSSTISPPPYNPFGGTGDGTEDLPAFNYKDCTGSNNFIPYEMVNDFNTDKFDWMFWDQLIKASESSNPFPSMPL